MDPSSQSTKVVWPGDHKSASILQVIKYSVCITLGIVLTVSFGLLLGNMISVPLQSQGATTESPSTTTMTTTPKVSTTTKRAIVVQCQENKCDLEYCSSVVDAYGQCRIDCRDRHGEDPDYPLSQIITELVEESVS